MRTIPDRQMSFAGGELAPGMYSRSDLAKYRIGCKTALNFFVGPHGQLISRPGTEKIDLISSYDEDAKARLFPFIYSSDTALLGVIRNSLSTLSNIRFYERDLDTNETAALVAAMTGGFVDTAAELP